MAKQTIVEAVKSGRVLISDGAWGTFLQNKGLVAGECPELWAVDRPADVKEIAESYFAAGADMVESDTFGGTSYKLEHFGLTARVGEINEAAARLSAEAFMINKKNGGFMLENIQLYIIKPEYFSRLKVEFTSAN